MSFTIFQVKKTPFYSIKTTSSKRRKICHVFKAVNPWFWSKNGHFSNLFFYAILARKMTFRIFQREQTPFQAIKTKSLKSRKIDIFPKELNHCVGPKITIFPYLFFNFLAIQEKKISFTTFQTEKKAFQAIKTRSSKSRKIDMFPKGLTHCFGRKMAIFPTFWGGQYKPGKCLLRFSRAKIRLYSL